MRCTEFFLNGAQPLGVRAYSGKPNVILTCFEPQIRAKFLNSGQYSFNYFLQGNPVKKFFDCSCCNHSAQ